MWNDLETQAGKIHQSINERKKKKKKAKGLRPLWGSTNLERKEMLVHVRDGRKQAEPYCHCEAQRWIWKALLLMHIKTDTPQLNKKNPTTTTQQHNSSIFGKKIYGGVLGAHLKGPDSLMWWLKKKLFGGQKPQKSWKKKVTKKKKKESMERRSVDIQLKVHVLRRLFVLKITLVTSKL